MECLSRTLGVPHPLPNEVLHEIIAIFCGEYVDSLIASVYDPENEISDITQSSSSGAPDSEARALDEKSDPPEVNAIVSLLQVSYRVREMTLSISEEWTFQEEGVAGNYGRNLRGTELTYCLLTLLGYWSNRGP